MATLQYPLLVTVHADATQELKIKQISYYYLPRTILIIYFALVKKDWCIFITLGSSFFIDSEALSHCCWRRVNDNFSSSHVLLSNKYLYFVIHPSTSCLVTLWAFLSFLNSNGRPLYFVEVDDSQLVNKSSELRIFPYMSEAMLQLFIETYKASCNFLKFDWTSSQNRRIRTTSSSFGQFSMHC